MAGQLPIVYTEGTKYQQAVEVANRMIPAYAPVAQLLAQQAGQPGDTSIKLWHDQIIAKLDNYPGSGGFTARTIGEGPSVEVDPDAKANTVVLQYGDVYRDPSLVSRVAAQLGNAAQRAVDDAVFTALAAAFSTTYSDGTGTPYLINANGGTLHTLKDGVTTQDNNVYAALSETSLDAARQKLLKWKNWADGTAVEYGRGTKILVVPPELGALARKLTGSPNLPFSSSGLVGMAMNDLAMQSWLVLETTQLTNTTRWFVIDAEYTPVRWAQFIPPRITVRDGDNLTTILEVACQVGAGIVGPPDGLVGSSA
jgi:hypothetical protein